jgi:hypothetical protein
MMFGHFWFGFVAGLLTAIGLFLIFLFLPEGNEPHQTYHPVEDDSNPHISRTTH